MATSRSPGPAGSHSVNTRDGTLCCLQSPIARPVGCNHVLTAKRKAKVLVYDGGKVYDILYHVAVAEIQWQNLYDNPQAAMEKTVPKERYLARTAVLFDGFLEACTEGPKQAHAYLDHWQDLQKKYLNKSNDILQSLLKQNADNRAVLGELAFAVQIIKSAATLTVGAIGVAVTFDVIVVPSIAVGTVVVGSDTLVALGYDAGGYIVSKMWPSDETHANTVVVEARPNYGLGTVGPKQTILNDALSVGADVKKRVLEKSIKVMKRRLPFRNKSSIYRSAVEEAGSIDILLRSLGIISMGAALWGEWVDLYGSYQQMQDLNNEKNKIRDSKPVQISKP